MKCFPILLNLACFCHIISTQSDGEPYSGLGHLKPRIEERIGLCHDIWAKGCLPNRTRLPTGLCHCAPVFEISAEKVQTVRLGGSITLFCVFFGYPLPAMLWRGPQTSLPAGRHKKTNWDTTLILNGITASDEGNYSCTASNIFGQGTHDLQIQVVAVPEFKNMTDGPFNVTLTEGETVTFNCNASAIPEANIIWLQNEKPIDIDNSSSRFVFSNDNKTLTIRDVCRDCVDRESKTDVMVIQCNASNVHGYAFAQGYLNVLMKTKVTIRGPENVSVDFLEEKQFVFQCNVTSDPSTPPTVRWYKTEPYGDLVRDEPPYVNVTNEFLIIAIDPKCSADCVKYLGEYRCVGDNGYSRDNRTITLPYIKRPPPKLDSQEEETWAVWKTILSVGAIGVGLLLVGIFLRLRSKQSSGEVTRQMKSGNICNPQSFYDDTGMPKLPSIYEDIGYDSVGLPLEELAANKEGSIPGEGNMYDHIGYDSIDQVLDEIVLKEDSMTRSPDVHGDNGYEPIDARRVESKGRGTPMLDEDITCDAMGYSILSGDVTVGK